MTLPLLIDVQTLLRLPAYRVRYLDASILLPGQEGDPEADFRKLALPGAVRFRIDDISDRTDSLPHTVPGAAAFARAMQDIGITRDTILVFYDRKGSIGACRAHWMASHFGHEQVCVLDGGLAALERAGIAIDAVPAPHDPSEVLQKASPDVSSHYTTRTRYSLLAGKGDVLDALTSSGKCVLDARSPARFYARVAEPRPNVRGGHMQNAINLPFTEVLGEEGYFLPPEALVARLRACGMGDRHVITSCGSGLTAATLTMALRVAGLPPGQLYDGSWAEWGSDSSVPVEMSDA